MLVLDVFSTSKAFLDHFVTLPNLGGLITVFEIQMHRIAISHCFFLFNPQALELFVPGLKIFRAELTNTTYFHVLRTCWFWALWGRTPVRAALLWDTCQASVLTHCETSVTAVKYPNDQSIKIGKSFKVFHHKSSFTILSLQFGNRVEKRVSGWIHTHNGSYERSNAL